MAEKSSELENIDETFIGIESNNDSLEERTENYSLAATDDTDGEAGTSEADDAQQIREQIEETRSQMSETIDAIQDRLSVANLTEQVKDQVSEQIGTAVESAKDALFDRTNAVAKSIGKGLADISASSLAKTTQENPWITSVLGMGIGAVLVGIFSSGTQIRKKNAAYRYKKFDKDDRRGDLYIGQTRQKFPSEEKTESVSQTARSKIGVVADTVSESVGSTAGKTYETVGKASSFAYKKAGELGGEMKRNYEHYIEENPLVVGAVAFAVGAAIGYVIPATKIENQYLGEARDNVIEKAQASAQDAIGSVKQVVGDAQKLIVDEVNKQVEEVKSQSAV